MAQPILLLADHLKGALSPITFEMLGAGRRLADALGAPLRVVLAGSGVAPLAAELGLADRVLVVDEPPWAMPPASKLAALLNQLIEREGAGLVLLAGTNVAMGVGSALSLRANLPFVNFCRGARLEDGQVLVTSQLFGGKMLVDVRLSENRGILSVYPGAFPADAGRSGQPPAQIEQINLAADGAPVTFRRFLEPELGDVDITRQNVLVAVGRGIQTEANLPLAEELAAALGGAVCASRPVIDQGWLPLSRQVGKSGMTVKPRLYVAVGISGAPEHVEGMQGASLIVAINTDPQAPIFDVAHYGVCADALEVLPALNEKIRARKS